MKDTKLSPSWRSSETYHLDEDVKSLQFVNLFQGKSLAFLQRLDVNARRYEDMKEAMIKANGLTIEESRDKCQKVLLYVKETVAQLA